MKNWFLTRLVDLREAVTVPGLSDNERLSRARMAAEEQQSIAQLAELGPYGPGSAYTRLGDVLDPTPQAGERGELDAVMRELQAVKIVPQPGPKPGPVPPYPLSQWFERYAVINTKLGPLEYLTAPLLKAKPVTDPDNPGTELPAVDGLPVGTIDPTGDLTPETAIALPASTSKRERWAVYGVEASRQVLLRTPEFTRVVEGFIACAVDRALEARLAADLADTSTPVALTEAETRIGQAWPTGADLLLCAAGDRMGWIRAYAAGGVRGEDRPDLVPVHGITAGTGILVASDAVHLEVTPTSYRTLEQTSLVTVGGYRYGRAIAAVPAAVQAVTLPTP